MNSIKAIWAECIGLFVDDGALAIAVVAWLALCRFILPRLVLPPVWTAVLLFAGLVLILAESALRRARSHPNPPTRRS